MTSISSAASGQQVHSPKQNILSAIASKASTGSISSTDQTALDSAVEDIDSSLSSGSTRSTSGPPDPAEMKSKVDSLIDDQVTSGKLTSDQASALKQILSDGGGQGGGGPGGVGGPPPGPPPSGASSSGSDTSSSSTSSTSTSTSSATDVSDLLASFLKDLQDSQSSTSGYGANGASSKTSLSNSLVFSFDA